MPVEGLTSLQPASLQDGSAAANRHSASAAPHGSAGPVGPARPSGSASVFKLPAASPPSGSSAPLGVTIGPAAPGADGAGRAALAPPRGAERTSVGQEFEAVTLAPLVEAMLPARDSAFWGGDSGRLWRSVFAQHLAEDVAAGGGLGLADLIDQLITKESQA